MTLFVSDPAFLPSGSRPNETLPTLDEAFVDHQLKVYKSKARRAIERAEAFRVFDIVERNPLFFQQRLIAMMAHASLTPKTALTHVLDGFGEQFGFAPTWNDLKPLQRATMRLLADRVDQIYADASANRLAQMTGDDVPTRSKVLSAVRRLSRLGVAEKQEDRWSLNDPLLEVWVRARHCPFVQFRAIFGEKDVATQARDAYRRVEGSSPACRAQPDASQFGGNFLVLNQWVRWLSLARVTRVKISQFTQ